MGVGPTPKRSNLKASSKYTTAATTPGNNASAAEAEAEAEAEAASLATSSSVSNVIHFALLPSPLKVGNMMACMKAVAAYVAGCPGSLVEIRGDTRARELYPFVYEDDGNFENFEAIVRGM